MKKFYLTYQSRSGSEPILQTLSAKFSQPFLLSWSHYQLLCRIENKSIGIIICKDKKDAVVEMTLPEDNKQIFASKYQLYLPSKEELKALIENERQNRKTIYNH